MIRIQLLQMTLQLHTPATRRIQQLGPPTMRHIIVYRASSPASSLPIPHPNHPSLRAARSSGFPPSLLPELMHIHGSRRPKLPVIRLLETHHPSPILLLCIMSRYQIVLQSPVVYPPFIQRASQLCDFVKLYVSVLPSIHAGR